MEDYLDGNGVSGDGGVTAAGDTSSAFAVETADTDEVFARIREDWDALAGEGRSLVLDHLWLSLDRESFHADKPLRLITVRKEGRLAAACLLVGWRRGGLLHWETIATDLPGSLVFETHAALTSLLEAVGRLPQPVVLKGIEKGGTVARCLEGGLPGRTIRMVRRADDVFFLPIRSTWEDFERALPSRRRKHHRRKRRKAEAQGAVAFEALSPDAAGVGSALDRFFAVEHANWKGEQGGSVLHRPDERAFVEGYARVAAEEGHLRLFFLTIGDRTAAGQLAVVHANRLWGLKIGYDAAFSVCSPGFLLDWEVLRWSHGEGLVGYEFMGKADAWEGFWSPERRAYRHARLYPLSLRGLVGLVVDAAALVLRRMGWKRR